MKNDSKQPILFINRFTTILGISTILLFTRIVNGAVTYNWDGTQTSANTGLDPGIASAAFTDPAQNQYFTTTPLALINGNSASSGYSGFTGGNNFQADVKIGSLDTSSSTFFVVTLTPVSGFSITLNSISFGSRSTGTGPKTISLFSSIDSFASAIGSVSDSANSTWTLKSPTLSGSLSGASGQAIQLRIYGSDGTGTQPTSANWRIDDINLNVSSSLSAVPEPTTWGAISALGLLGICGLREWRQRKQGQAV
jgi:hypothetical protein